MANYFLFVIVWCTTQFNSFSSQPYRLPNNLNPFRYVLTMEPNLEKEVFNGSVVIDLIATEDTQNVIIHIRNLTIGENDIKVMNGSGYEIAILETSSQDDNETFTIHLENELKKDGNYSLRIGNFSGSLLVENKVGFYLVFYDDENGLGRRLAVTDFGPADARQAFPCFDEPALKAKFIVNIIRENKYTSLSNEKLESIIDLGNGRYLDTYKETGKMSTYLVAFAVSEFVAIQVTEKHRIFSRPKPISQGQFSCATDVLDDILKSLENFTGIDYPMSKLDILAIPDGQFTATAMENSGLIIFEELSLYCTNYSSTIIIQNCITTVCHEVVHQWFGNLVTMSWWDYIWLKEGFATYLQYYITSIIRPSWRLMDQFVVEKLHLAFSLDLNEDYRDRSLNSQLPNPNASTHYLAYAKGSSIVRMVEHFLTHAVFKKGIRGHLENRKFGSAEPSDLYEALQIAVDDAGANSLLGNLTVAAILETWTNSPGHPIVNVTRNYETGSITFTQNRYYTERQRDVNETLWHIPVNYVLQSDPKEKLLRTTADFWLSQKSITINNLTSEGWLLVNIQEMGVYRVNYDLKNWERLIHFLTNDDFKTIPVLNRAKLINDAFRLAEDKKLSFDIVLRLTEYLQRERDYIPVLAFTYNMDKMKDFFRQYVQKEHNLQELPFWNNSLQSIFKGRAGRKIFQEYKNHLLGELYNYLGIDEKPSDTHLDKLTRSSVVDTLTDSHAKCKSDILKKFQQLKQDNSAHIASDLQSTIFCASVKTKADYFFLYKLHLQKPLSFISENVKYSLSCYKDKVKFIKNGILRFMAPLRFPFFQKLKFNWLPYL